MYSVLGISYRKRMLLLFTGFLVVAVGLMSRLAFIQLVRGEELRKDALEVRMHEIQVQPKRGKIVDRNGQPLALSVNVDTVFASPYMVKNKTATAHLLAGILKLDESQLLSKLSQNVGFVYVKRKISDDESKAIRQALKDDAAKPQDERLLSGVEITQEGQRYYPNNDLAANVLGIAGIDNQGLEGLELYYDQELKGQPGFIATETDARGRWISDAPHQYQAPEDGDTLVTTLDANVQLIAQRGSEQVRLATDAKRVAIIVEDMNGGVLAFAQSPTFDPNHYQDTTAAERRPWPLADTLYPGSVFKMVTAAAALQTGAVKPNDTFYDPGSIRVGDHTFHDWDGAALGSIDLGTVIEKSSNVGFIQIGQRLGLDDFYKYVHAFNLDRPTGIDLPGEGRGLMPPRKSATQVDLAAMSFGQTLTVTPIAMVNAAATIANGGRFVRPHFGMELRTPDGHLVKDLRPEPGDQIISTDTSKVLAGMLERVISQGTGKMAYVPGYRLAGKTGTAQKNVNGRVSSDKHTAAFVGFGPVDNPKIAVAIVIDEPGPSVPYYGGQIAAPVFGVVMGDLLHYLEIPPTEPKVANPGDKPALPAEVVEVPSLVNLPVQDARQAAYEAGFNLKVDGDYALVTRQVPPAGAKLPKGTTILVEAKDSDVTAVGQTRVPDLTGKTLREAASLLAVQGLRLASEGSGLAASQDAAPGSLVPAGTTIHVTFQTPASSP